MVNKTDKENGKTTDIKESGIYIRGVVVSSNAKVWKRKDGSGFFVCVKHELALQPGMAVWEEYYDPDRDSEVETDGLELRKYPKIPEFESVLLRTKQVKVRNDLVHVSNVERIN